MKTRFVALYAIFGAYLYLLLKIVLFKGHGIQLPYMAEQLQAMIHDPYGIARRMERGNLVPLHEIKRFMASGTTRGYLNVYGNIAIFVPFGLLRGMLANGRRMTLTSAAAGSFFLSLTLEWLQAAFAIGQFDVDDILLNVSGGVMGYLSYRLLKQGWQWFRKPRGSAAESITPARTNLIQ